ncbi:MAG: GNAT family N-acetyltransferase [Cenarchaeum symbiont of Oopsacas minuta]|nr:GNAT family N-acetyltransferase [Cenarchaeum symbiont of Oopsacas minuta]
MQAATHQIDDYVIRLAEPKDLIPIIEINLKTLPEHYSDFFYESLLSEFQETFMVAESSGRDVGYVMCKCEHGFSNFKKLGFVKKCHLVSVAVLEEHRRKGMGRSLVNGAISGARTYRCEELYLEVRCSNNEAVDLYQKMNFKVRNKLGSYYRDGEDAYLMSIEFDYS